MSRLSLNVLSLVDALAAALRERVFAGELPGGTPITEKEVATFYGVARPTARAALGRLVYEGLLRRDHNRGARVPLLSSRDVSDVYFSRALVERPLVATLAQLGCVPVSAREAVARLSSIPKAWPASSLIDTVTADAAFHLALVEALDSPRLTRTYATLTGEAHLCMASIQAYRLVAPDIIASEHAAILDALEAGDTEQAVACLDDHLEHARSRLAERLGGSSTSGTGARRPDVGHVE